MRTTLLVVHLAVLGRLDGPGTELKVLAREELPTLKARRGWRSEHRLAALLRTCFQAEALTQAQGA